MAQYVYLIYGEEREDVTAEQWAQMLAAHAEFVRSLEARGAKVLAGEALEPTRTATSVSLASSGERVVTDGPFVETKEALGGFYLIECSDLDEAIAIGRMLPVSSGGVEIRPVADTSGGQ
jgi:hypothetical protein